MATRIPDGVLMKDSRQRRLASRLRPVCVASLLKNWRTHGAMLSRTSLRAVPTFSRRPWSCRQPRHEHAVGDAEMLGSSGVPPAARHGEHAMRSRSTRRDGGGESVGRRKGSSSPTIEGSSDRARRWRRDSERRLSSDGEFVRPLEIDQAQLVGRPCHHLAAEPRLFFHGRRTFSRDASCAEQRAAMECNAKLLEEGGRGNGRRCCASS